MLTNETTRIALSLCRILLLASIAYVLNTAFLGAEDVRQNEIRLEELLRGRRMNTGSAAGETQ